MSRQFSTGLRNLLCANAPLKQVMNGARMVLYSSAQVADADTGVSTANILATLTASGAVFTGETRAEWKSTIGGAATGALNALFMGEQVYTNTSDAAGSATTIKLTGGTATNDIYNGMYVYISAGTGKGNVAQIVDYVGSTLVATVAAINGVPFVAPGNDSVFHVINGFELLGAGIAYTTDAATTATNVVTQINDFSSLPDLRAYAVSAGEYRIKAPNGSGTILNGLKLYGAVSGSLTNTIASLEIAGGVFVKGIAQTGGVVWSGVAASGQIPLLSTWSTGTGVTYGAAGSPSKGGVLASFRILVDPADDGSTTSTDYPRIDGNIGTLTTNDLQMSSTTRVQGDPIIISTYPLGFKQTTTA